MFITKTRHNPPNNILIHFLDTFRRFSKLQILFLCLTIILFVIPNAFNVPFEEITSHAYASPTLHWTKR